MCISPSHFLLPSLQMGCTSTDSSTSSLSNAPFFSFFFFSICICLLSFYGTYRMRRQFDVRNQQRYERWSAV
ncbi:hypothetical protein STCU_11814 [Strigomonas culicis]|uniref:Uncharacterized protein n=1 Tax=Strigomonas culicis TaxID=28005 RepID=S9THA1_9TRYP|nr:hypothetical protein STCU_11814 [Strigomonas culicis]|eukprot:EPY15713.1 hypothetical protein STCU_11814 [Strigomonas culicis]